jgi:transcriptional regulator with XRE-family HTH domain
MPVTAAQIRAARELLGWSQADLAVKLRVRTSAIAKFEQGGPRPRMLALSAMKFALEAAGVKFSEGEPGVKRGQSMAKQTWTRDQLAAAILERLKSFPECRVVTGVAVAPVVKATEGDPNWGAAFTIASGRAEPSIAQQIVSELAVLFDLA